MKNLIISVSPHIHTRNGTQSIMRDVLIALLPALVASSIIFGEGALVRCLFSVVACVALEFCWNVLLKKEQSVSDLSAAVTGLLLAYNVPASLPLWELFIGDFIAIVIVKMLFGGLGCNFVNPALAGRVSLMVSFTSDMTAYTAASAAADLVSSATPLADAANLTGSDFVTLLLGRHGGVLGETCALALLIGGAYLVIRKVIKPIIPLCFMASCAFFTWIFGGSAPLLSLFTGGIMLGSIFMATDYVTSPITDKGRVVFGLGCGFLTACIRCFASSAEGISFAILLMNLLVPYINEGFRTKPFGEVKAK